MADKEKKALSSDVDKAATDESKAAEKVAKAAKGSSKKSDRPGFFARAGKSTKRFFKDFRGETKKIVWPDAKMVLKSTGVVLLVVAIVSIIIYGIDQGLSAGITGLKKLATNDTSVSETVDGEQTEAEGESENADADATEKTTAAEDEKEDDKEKTEATSGETTEEAATEPTSEEAQSTEAETTEAK